MTSPRVDANKYMNTPRRTRDVHALCGQSEGVDKALFELVKIRASQINGCAYCIDMHTKDARAAGETEQRIYALNAWRETPFFTERERAALEWTEAVTLVARRMCRTRSTRAWHAQFDEAETRRADVRGRRDQQLEPAVGVVPAGGRQLPAEERKRHGLRTRISAARRAPIPGGKGAFEERWAEQGPRAQAPAAA